jgi:hypothetical protein
VASVFIMINIEAFLVLLEALVHGLFSGIIRAASFRNKDNVNLLHEDEKDIIVVGKVCRAFEEIWRYP